MIGILPSVAGISTFYKDYVFTINLLSSIWIGRLGSCEDFDLMGENEEEIFYGDGGGGSGGLIDNYRL